MSWTQPICERCWIERNSGVVKDVADSIAIIMPFVMQEPTLEFCGFCGAPTIVGIYTRQDPKTIKKE